MNQLHKIRLPVVAAGILTDLFLSVQFAQIENIISPESVLYPFTGTSLLLSFVIGLPPVLFAGILVARLERIDWKLNCAVLGALLTLLPIWMHAIFPTWYIAANCLLLIPVAVAGGILGSSPYLQARFSTELMLLFYSWIAGSYLMRPFTSTLLFALRNTLAHASQHIAGIIAWPLIISPLPFLVAFLFAWLAGGSWTKRAVQTWAVVWIASLLKGTSGGATLVSFFVYALFSLFLPGVMHLAAALFGSWLACRGFVRKYLEPARNAFLQSALLPRQ